ncbi:cell wall-associated NlpC family hydrolase [Streptomyces sp. SLBN-118]|uniref:C40 family peptidase n=1 Tax=Streptomyces sp. SLBN-118 TaxID=2768454 RepID=UPI00114F349A|nr:C40 family peptidase [Streptomyces sp. SLBN-118]TQK52592.1 cell wall-associated NlpC family hydrolase [Streptomyces sp. SLBN-118]
MSHTAHIPSHRKPRRSSSKLALRAGVAGGVLSTIAVASGAGAATADPVTETIEMPTLSSGLSAAVTQSAEATQQVALDLELQAQEDAAAAKAAQTAKKAKAEAERKAEAKEKAEAKKRAEAEAKERASRSSERTTLSAPSSSSNATGSAATVVAFLKAQLGDAYVMGATGPNSWDCSSLVQAAFRQVGIDLPRVSQDQSVAGTQVGTSNLQIGDILYWGGAGSAYHVAVYIGDGQYLDAANPSKGVVIQDLSGYPASGAVRVL